MNEIDWVFVSRSLFLNGCLFLLDIDLHQHLKIAPGSSISLPSSACKHKIEPPFQTSQRGQPIGHLLLLFCVYTAARSVPQIVYCCCFSSGLFASVPIPSVPTFNQPIPLIFPQLLAAIQPANDPSFHLLLPVTVHSNPSNLAFVLSFKLGPLFPSNPFSHI